MTKEIYLQCKCGHEIEAADDCDNLKPGEFADGYESELCPVCKRTGCFTVVEDTEAKHTPSPFIILVGEDKTGPHLEYYETGADLSAGVGYPVDELPEDERGALLEQVAVKVNSHADLLEAAGDIHRLGLMIQARLDVEEKEAETDSYCCAAYHEELKERLRKLWATIAKAKGETK